MNFFGLAKKTERSDKVILKDIPNDFKIDEVKVELVTLDFPLTFQPTKKHHKKILQYFLLIFFLSKIATIFIKKIIL